MTRPPTLVSDLMTPEPLTMSPSTPVAELAAAMGERGIRHIPIVQDGKLVGMVSSRDTFRGGPLATDVMTRQPLTIGPNERIEVAAAMMALRKISALLVVEPDGLLVGILTTYDVLDAFARRLRDEG
jgi:acetoin utilization protein AcuB